ncbi:TerB family tellurite resistance protein [Hydrogenophaga sp.]|uniref:tellurite resistance TerB family protein n=1 Tax=Hydrogenophaga sp. TaxID=1904254 RepID=UPI003F72B4D8
MLRNLKDLFDTLTTSLSAPAGALAPAEQQHTLQLATAVLLVEVMRAEPTLQDSERDAVLTALRRKFALGDDELQRLLELAHDTARTAYDYQRFTGLMNERFSQPQKIAVVEAMWEVAFADHHLDAHEHHVISKVAGLLHVTHGEYIAAKLHAQAAMKG